MVSCIQDFFLNSCYHFNPSSATFERGINLCDYFGWGKLIPLTSGRMLPNLVPQERSWGKQEEKDVLFVNVQNSDLYYEDKFLIDLKNA